MLDEFSIPQGTPVITTAITQITDNADSELVRVILGAALATTATIVFYNSATATSTGTMLTIGPQGAQGSYPTSIECGIRMGNGIVVKASVKTAFTVVYRS